MSPISRLEHPCLRELVGDRVVEAELTDRAKLAVVLQAAGLLAHLDAAGWKLVGGLEEGHVVSTGALAGLVAQPGRDSLPAHRRLRDFLLALFRCESEISGRGEARRSARRLAVAWEQSLAPLTITEILRQIFNFSPFLWKSDFDYARHALFAEEAGSGETRVVGPMAFQLQVERHLDGGETPRSLIAAGELRRDWSGAGAGDPTELARNSRWAAAVSAFRVGGFRGDEQRVLFAQCLLATGKFEQAVEVVQRVSRIEAEVVRLLCLVRLQRLGAARKQLAKLEKRTLNDQQQTKVGDVALRMLFNLGDLKGVDRWRSKLAKMDRSPWNMLATASLASSAYDFGDTESAAHLVSAGAALRDHPQHGWKWYNAEGLRALSAGQGGQAEQAFGCALVQFRRQMTPVRASLMWANLVSAAELRGDTVRAERAARNAYRLAMGFEGPLTTSVHLYNLVEVLLKQGKVEGVRELVDAAAKADQLAGNLRAVVHDVELLARYHLTRGRSDRALRVVDEFLVQETFEWRRPVLQAWAARALGLMGRPEDAAQRLRDGGEEGLTTFDLEEIPAVWALAGERHRAQQAIDGETFELWSGALAGVPLSTESWARIGSLGGFRAARLIRDLELMSPGYVPRRQRLSAIRSFRQLGLELWARFVEGNTGDAWSAVAEYLDPETGGDIAALFSGTGYGDVRLEWDGPDAGVLVEGQGGRERQTLDAGAGRLILDADHVDAPLRALMGLVVRETSLRQATVSRVAGDHGGIVGESPALLAALDRVDRLARSDLPILILGETGTGKELVAKWVHQRSQRAQGPFVPVNCAAVSESLLLSDLFGHVKGAFTGAEKDRAGHFESANRGTVFLDEVGDLPFDAQGRFLRLLQESEVMRLGESRVRKVDTRVVAATHRDLTRMLDDATFRQDLFYRLHVGRVELPPLRERGQDVILIARHFLAQWSREDRAFHLESEAVTKLLRHPWPGNVRELENVLRLATALSDDGRIAADDLEFSQPDAPPRTDFQVEVDRFRRKLIEDALKRTGGNQAEAARSVGLTRQGLSYWIRKLGIRV